MKAQRYLHPDRILDQAIENDDMNDNTDLESADGEQPAAATTLAVEVGRAMPPADPNALPLLNTPLAAPVPLASDCSTVAEGMQFIGNAVLRGACSVAGHVEGNLTQAEGATVSVVVTETGLVKGDISAQKISVMGRTEGVLDAGHGEVALHDTASVHGLVRYGRIQVNGADLNATLERAPNPKPAA